MVHRFDVRTQQALGTPIKVGSLVDALAYEVDGQRRDEGAKNDQETAQIALNALGGFMAAEAGLVNAANALRFLEVRVPEVDPNRLIAVGHS